MAGAPVGNNNDHDRPAHTRVDAKTAQLAGVWAATSAKKDKLLELRGELQEGRLYLDEAATAGQSLDLYLADGLTAIAKTGDDRSSGGDDHAELTDWLASTEEGHVSKSLYEAHLRHVVRRVNAAVADLSSTSSLALLRDLMEAPKEEEEDEEKDEAAPSAKTTATEPTPNDDTVDTAFHDTCRLYAALRLKAAAEVLLASWDTLVTMSDGDKDRAAVQGVDAPSTVTSLPLPKVDAVLRSYVVDGHDPVAAWWDLVDKDEDGLLDQGEVESVVRMSMEPVEQALESLFDKALDAHPVTVPLPALGSKVDTTTPMTWRQQRQEKKAQKRLRKTFRGAIKNHFAVELEAPHRLRCIYAWAHKAHQHDRIDSVVVDTGAEDALGLLAGKKRYVELQPKISHAEFQLEQRVHFPHLDRVGEEIVASFKEDLHVQQGQGRQNKDLRREIAGFVVVVTLLDGAIAFL